MIIEGSKFWKILLDQLDQWEENERKPFWTNTYPEGGDEKSWFSKLKPKMLKKEEEDKSHALEEGMGKKRGIT